MELLKNTSMVSSSRTLITESSNLNHAQCVKSLAGPQLPDRSINWIRRLEIAEDSAKGL